MIISGAIMYESDAARVVLREGLVPEDLRPLAHVVVVSQRLALLSDALLHAVLEVPTLLVALRLQHALQEDLLVLHAGRLVLLPRRAYRVVNRLEHPVQPPVEPIVRLLTHIIIVMRGWW
jgi:hypothetical protein